MWCSNLSRSFLPSEIPLHRNSLMQILCGWGVLQWTLKYVRGCILLEFLCGLFATKITSCWWWILSNLCNWCSPTISSRLTIQKMGEWINFVSYSMVQMVPSVSGIHRGTTKAHLLMRLSQWQAHLPQTFCHQIYCLPTVSSTVWSDLGLQGRKCPWPLSKVCKFTAMYNSPNNQQAETSNGRNLTFRKSHELWIFCSSMEEGW